MMQMKIHKAIKVLSRRDRYIHLVLPPTPPLLTCGCAQDLRRNGREGFQRIKPHSPGTSLVAQWLRIHLPVQGTWVRALVREDPTCCGTAQLCATTTEPAF